MEIVKTPTGYILNIKKLNKTISYPFDKRGKQIGTAPILVSTDRPMTAKDILELRQGGVE